MLVETDVFLTHGFFDPTLRHLGDSDKVVEVSVAVAFLVNRFEHQHRMTTTKSRRAFGASFGVDQKIVTGFVVPDFGDGVAESEFLE